MSSRDVPTIPVSAVLTNDLQCLQREAARRRSGKGVRDSEVDASARAIATMARTHGSDLLPVSASCAEAFTELLTSDESNESDTEIWASAAQCSMQWHGAFAEFVRTVFDLTVRQRSRGGNLSSKMWLSSAAALKCLTTVVVSVGFSGEEELLREYAECLSGLVGDSIQEAVLEHLDALVRLVTPTSPVLLSVAMAKVSVGLRSGDLAVKKAALLLRSSIGIIVHPRCAPIYVPVLPPAATRAERVVAEHQASGSEPDGSAVKQALPAVRERAPAPLGMANSMGAPPVKAHRHSVAQPAAPQATTQQSPADVDGEMPEIVDDDLE